MVNRIQIPKPKIGVFGVGHATYWAQFGGLFDRLMGYHEEMKAIVRQNNVDIIDYGMVDTSETAYHVLDKMLADRLDLIFCNMLTYATSSTFAPIIRDAKAPVVLVALQPLAAMDYSKANTVMQLENDNICSVPEFTGVALRMGRAVADVIIGTLRDYGTTGSKLNDRQHDTVASKIANRHVASISKSVDWHGAAVREIADWCDAAAAIRSLRGARIGLMGHVLEAMYDMHADPTAVSAAFGLHAPLLEPDDLLQCLDEVTDNAVAAKKAYILQEFETPDPKGDPVTCKLIEGDLHEAASTAVALDIFIKRHNLTGFAYHYEGMPGSPHQKICSSLVVGNSILNGLGFPMCGEYDLKTCVAMLIMDRMGMGGSFAEFHPLDFNENFVLIGHDGPHHIAIANEKPVLRGLVKFHGKPGFGASVEFKIKEGPITMLGVTQTYDGRMKFVVGEGMSMKGPIPPTGNTNTRGFFMPDTPTFVKEWVKQGPTHHFALGVGHRAAAIVKLGRALGIETVVVAL